MIIVKLIGGLGNQLFQYSFGRLLSHKNNSVLKLDTSAFYNYKLHNYSLNHFNIKESIISETERNFFFFDSPTLNITVLKHITPKFFRFSSKYIKAKDIYFHSDYLDLRGDFYLEGYWQSENFFVEIRDILLNELTVNTPITKSNSDYLDNIKATNSVSLHIRRADYLDNLKTNSVHGVCEINYYNKAVNKIFENVTDPVFFVFTDDHEWVKKELNIGCPFNLIEGNNAEFNYEDLRLMKNCKHNIIANSTFSWWGAWLNNNIDKLIIAPKQWFLTDEYSAKDILPKNFIKL